MSNIIGREELQQLARRAAELVLDDHECSRFGVTRVEHERQRTLVVVTDNGKAIHGKPKFERYEIKLVPIEEKDPN